jgi:Amt family ammonium transporter
VGAVAVHGVCGAWGALAVGIFADGTYGAGWNGVAGPVRGVLFGDPGQLAAQAIGVITNVVVVGAATWLFFRVVNRLIGNRVTAEVEWTGLDATEMGSEAYPQG